MSGEPSLLQQVDSPSSTCSTATSSTSSTSSMATSSCSPSGLKGSPGSSRKGEDGDDGKSSYTSLVESRPSATKTLLTQVCKSKRWLICIAKGIELLNPQSTHKQNFVFDLIICITRNRLYRLRIEGDN